MRDDEIRRTLTDANPWWRAAAARTDPTAWTRDHRLLQDRANHDLGFRPAVLGDIATGPITDQLAVLTGPRRIASPSHSSTRPPPCVPGPTSTPGR